MQTRALFPAVLAVAAAFGAGCSGGGGGGSGDPGNPSCTYTLSAPSSLAPAPGGTGTIGVSARADCAWNATSSNGWLSITAGASGTGDGTVHYAVAANPGSAERSGTIVVAGHAFTVVQEGAACAYTLLPESASFSAASSSGSIAVSAPAGCAWSAASDAPWLTIVSGAGGSGPATVQYQVAPNTSDAPREGTLTVAGLTFPVLQAGLSCSYGVAPASASIGPGAAAGAFDVIAPDGCPWTAAPDVGWIGITSGASGSGSGTVDYDVGENPAASQRQGTIAVAGESYTVTQDPAPCLFSIAPTSASLGAAWESTTFEVTAPSGCAWDAVSDSGWITVVGASGNGPGYVELAVDPNPGDADRTGTVTVEGQVFTVVQRSGSEVIIILQ